MRVPLIARVALLAALALVPARAWAQGGQITGVEPRVSQGTITATDPGTCTVSNAGCVVIIPGGYTAVSIQVSGTWVGTIQFESCTANCSSSGAWASMALTTPGGSPTISSTTANGLWVAINPSTFMRARFSAFTSGTANVTLYATLGSGSPSGNLSSVSTPLNNVTNATGTQTDSHGNFNVVWGWTLTGDGSGLTFNEPSPSTGASNVLGYTESVISVGTQPTSTASALFANCTSGASACLASYYTSGGAIPAIGALPSAPVPLDHKQNTNGIAVQWRSMNGAGRLGTSGDSGIYMLVEGLNTGIGTTADCSGCEISFPAGSRGRPFSVFTNNNFTAPNVTFNVNGSTDLWGAVVNHGTVGFGGQVYTWPATTGSSSQCLETNGATPATLSWSACSAGGTVTSVGLAAPAALCTISGSPVTSSGTITCAAPTESANNFYAGPSSGAAAAPTFRTLAVNDFNSGTGASSSTFWRGDGTWASVGGATAALSAITSATAQNNTLTSGNNFGQLWQWALTSNSVCAFCIGESAHATSGTADNQRIFGVDSLTSSTAIPFYNKCLTNADCFRIDTGASSLSQTFTIDNAGHVGIDTAPVAGKNLAVLATGNMFDTFQLSDGTNTIIADNNGGPEIGSGTNASFSLMANDAAPSLTITTGSLVQLRGTALTALGTGATLSGCSFSAQAGGKTGGQFTSGTTGTCTVAISGLPTAPNGYWCEGHDVTNPLVMTQTATTTTGCTISGATTSSDKIVWWAFAF